jgi:hypothetical protein
MAALHKTDEAGRGEGDGWDSHLHPEPFERERATPVLLAVRRRVCELVAALAPLHPAPSLAGEVGHSELVLVMTRVLVLVLERRLSFVRSSLPLELP